MEYNDQIRDIRRVTWDGMEAMSFHQLRLGIESLQQQVKALEQEVVQLTQENADLKSEPDDPEVESLEAEIDLWFDLACDLYSVLLMMEEQMAQRGIGIRPVGQQILERFREAMEHVAFESDLDASGTIHVAVDDSEESGEPDWESLDGETYNYLTRMDEDDED